MTKQADAVLWHQRLLHCGTHTFKKLHEQVDGVPNLSKMEPFDDVNKCTTCMKAKLTKVPADHISLRATLNTPYQGLYIDFGFAGKVLKDKDDKVLEEARTDVEGLNGENSWILLSDGLTRIMHGDCRLSKASPIKYLDSFLKQYSPNMGPGKKWVVLRA